MRRVNCLDAAFLAACLAWLGLGSSAVHADPPAKALSQLQSQLKTPEAAPPPSAPTLGIGDTPPPLVPMAWVKGAPVAAFQRDHVYVVAFFATWCGASRQSMPLLSDVARRYKGQVTVIGVNVREAERREATVSAVTQFVQARGQDMDYTVAMDDPAGTALFTSWMRAAGVYAIPTAFIVGRDGRLAYVGIPIDPEASYGFEEAVQQAVAGTSDLVAARRQQDDLRAQIAQYLADNALMKPLDEAMQRKDYRAVLVEADRIVEQDPQREARVFGDRLRAMLHLDEAGALAFARRTHAAAEGGGISVPGAQLAPGELSRAIAGTIGSVIAYTPGLSRQAYEMAAGRLETVIPEHGGDFNTVFDLIALAQLQQQLGRGERAVAAQQRAVDIARGRKDVTGDMMAGLEKTLAEYRAGGRGTAP